METSLSRTKSPNGIMVPGESARRGPWVGTLLPIRLSLRSPAVQGVLLASVLVGALPSVLGAIGVTAPALRLGIISAGAAIMFCYLRHRLGADASIAAPCALLYLAHPLWVGQLVGPNETLTALPVLLIPSLFVAVHQAVTTRGLWIVAALGLLQGTAMAVDHRGGLLLLVVSGIYATAEIFIAGQMRNALTRWRESAVHLAAFAAITIVVALSLPGVLGRFGPVSQKDGTVDASSRVLTAPFALVDRDGLLSSRLEVLPSGLATGGGTNYLGWAVVALGVIAVWPSRKADAESLRRLGALLILALALLWLLRGPASPHSQLRQVFEFATVRRYVEPMTLHLLGALIIPLMALPLLVFLSVGCLIRTGPSWAFGSIMISAAAAILWWGTSPGALPGLASRLVPATQDWRLLAPLIVFPLVCGVATGLQRICTSVRSKAGQLLLWSCVLVLLAADLGGSARKAVLQPARPTQQTLSTRIYAKERECVQASPGFTGEGFWPTDWSVTPSSLQSV